MFLCMPSIDKPPSVMALLVPTSLVANDPVTVPATVTVSPDSTLDSEILVASTLEVASELPLYTRSVVLKLTAEMVFFCTVIFTVTVSVS